MSEIVLVSSHVRVKTVPPALLATMGWSPELFAGPEAAEGMAAYLEKRPAPWIPTADTPEL